MVMEYLDGETSASRIKRKGRLSPGRRPVHRAQLLEGLGAAHHAGIIHRDLKPDNIFLTYDARRLFREDPRLRRLEVRTRHGRRARMSMTKTGAVMGTPQYMSPEQARGLKDIDHRSDLYSVGVLLYQAVTGRVPFHAETFNELVFKIALEAPPPRRAMERDPAHRFQSAAGRSPDGERAYAGGATLPVRVGAERRFDAGHGRVGVVRGRARGEPVVTDGRRTADGAVAGRARGDHRPVQEGAPRSRSASGSWRSSVSRRGVFLWLRGPSRTATAATSAPTAEVSTTATRDADAPPLGPSLRSDRDGLRQRFPRSRQSSRSPRLSRARADPATREATGARPADHRTPREEREARRPAPSRRRRRGAGRSTTASERRAQRRAR
jgi:hypothetical protein